jgi:transposase-like protein
MPTGIRENGSDRRKPCRRAKTIESVNKPPRVREPKAEGEVIGRMADHSWPTAVRQEAAELAADPDLSAEQIRQRLRAEQGADVPTGTVRRWVREARQDFPAPSIGDLSGRILALLSADLRRLERQPTAKLDVDRLAKLAATLKSLDGLKTQAKLGAPAKTLNDLNDSEAQTPKAFPLSDAPSVRDLERLG